VLRPGSVILEFIKCNEHLISLGRGFCDAGHRAELEAFFKERLATLPGGPLQLKQMLEWITQCENDKPLQQPSISAFLSRY